MKVLQLIWLVLVVVITMPLAAIFRAVKNLTGIVGLPIWILTVIYGTRIAVMKSKKEVAYWKFSFPKLLDSEVLLPGWVLPYPALEMAKMEWAGKFTSQSELMERRIEDIGIKLDLPK